MRVAQFIVIGLFARFMPAALVPRVIFGIFFTGILLLGYLALPFLAHSGEERLKEKLVGSGMFFYLGYFLAGAIEYYGYLLLFA